ncbi:MAG: protein-export chaperone SecB [Gammaproteobacteria bacterium]|nr:protein-export chaperone SecB [Gammaproteobacteria bacterium]
MSETADQAAGNQSRFQIQKIYTRDVSVETPNSPQIFQVEWKPDVNVQLGNSAKKIGDQVHEVITTVTVTTKLDDKTAYLIEVQQAGIFTIEGFADEELGQMVGSYCPNILFPYAREAISDLIAKAGFPQLLLAPVNFDAIYAQHQQQIQAGEQAEPSTTH